MAALLATVSCPIAAAALTLSDADVEAIGRVVYAEAGREPIPGKVAVLDTILNRLASGGFGATVQAVIAERNAFEPVTRAGGWQHLLPLTATERAEFLTILALKAAGHLGDVSGGGLYFQNEEIVAQRARRGRVKASLVGFNGMPRTATIGNHTFYRPAGTPDHALPATPRPAKSAPASMFVGVSEEAAEAAATGFPDATAFVVPDGAGE